MEQEVEGVDFFTSDLIRRTRARKKRLEKEMGEPSADQTSSDFVFDENLGQIVRKQSGDSGSGSAASLDAQPKSPAKRQSVAKSVLSPSRTAFSNASPSIPFIDKSSTDSLTEAAASSAHSSGSSACDLPRYKVEIPSRFSPIKKNVSRKFSPAVVSSQAFVPKSTSSSSSSVTNSLAEKAASLVRKSPKPIMEKFEVMRKEVEKEMTSETSKKVADVPVSSIRGRIEKLENIFAQQAPADPPTPAPETLSLKHKKVLFEKKIKEEAGQKIAGIKRNEYLAQKRGRSESKLPAVSPGIVAKMQQKILARQLETESDTADQAGHYDAQEAAKQANCEQGLADEKILNTEMDSVEVKSQLSDFDKMNEESALAAFFDIEKMDGDSVDAEMETEQQNPYFSKTDTESSPSSPSGTDTMSMCTQYSQSDKEFDSLPSSPSKSSSGSQKIYPDLAVENEVKEALPSSPKKLRFCDEVHAAPTPPEPRTSGTTPLRTLSRYRLEQKQLQKETPQQTPKVVFGTTKSQSSCDKLDNERKAELRRRVNLLKHEEVPRCDAMIHQSVQALKACLVSDFRDTMSHADAERHVLVSKMKRTAALNEISALNAQILSPLPKESVSGHLTIQRLDLPIMRDAILAHKKGLNAKSPETNYYFCVTSCGPVVHSTECLSFSDGYSTGYLSFNLHSGLAFPCLRNNFQLRVDVYEVSLVKASKKESGRTIRLTPRKQPNPSPAASDANSEPLAHLKGTVIVNVKNIKKKDFDLQNFRFESSLQGSIRIGMTFAAEYKNDYSNFLNFYDEKVDIGTWKRRWCHVNGPVVRIWRLPEDEEAGKKMQGEIDLRHCINPSITPAPFDVCPRKESFVLVFAGTASDKTRLRVNWLVNKNYRDVIERNLVAADVLEERDEWISTLNEILDGMRLWDEEALIPCSQADIQSYINV